MMCFRMRFSETHAVAKVERAFSNTKSRCTSSIDLSPAGLSGDRQKSRGMLMALAEPWS